MTKLVKVPGSNGEALQDSFVLNMLNFKKGGYYVELGSASPIKYNNTYLLEREYNWSGVSFDIDTVFYNEFVKMRNNPIIFHDATNFDYKSYFDQKCKDNRLDLLQVDIDPTEASFKAMLKVLESGYSFNVITFEHNIYHDKSNLSYQEDVYKILSEYGYVRYAKNVKVVSKIKDSNGSWDAFEDWYVHKDLNFKENTFSGVKFTKIFKLTLREYIMEELKRYSRKLYYYKNIANN